MEQSRKKIKKYMIYLDHELGKGATGKVYLCYHQSSPKTPLAVKVVQKKSITHQLCLVDNNQYLKIALKRQLNVHKKLKNENIVELIDYEETKNNIYIFQEFCEGSSLKQLLQKKKRLTEQEVVECAKQIVHGFSQIVIKGVIHRDLKPQNILVSSHMLKICDFGFSKLTYTQKQLTASLVGSPAYMAPQILQGIKYSSKCDVWSFGIILYQLLYGVLPWGHRQRTTAGLLTQILTSPLSFPSDKLVSNHMKSFIQNCLKMDEKLRLSWLEIFEAPIFQGQFDSIAVQFQTNMKTAAKMLDDLVGRVNVTELIGAFLQFRVQALDYSQFEKIIKWNQFIPEATQAQIGFMYEMFDKDCNGVIDIYEFVKAFEVCDDQIPSLLNQLLQKELQYDDLQNHQTFITQSCKLEYSKQVIEITWQILQALTFNEK